MIRKYAFIIGAMKSGTTTLFDYLNHHPDIVGVFPKEPAFFADDDVYAKGGDWYHSLFQGEDIQDKIYLDGSTDYTKYPHFPEAAKRISALEGEVKLIYIMRHPLRRIESHARHVQKARSELSRIPSPRKDHGLDHGVSDVSLDISRYALQIDQYRSFFDQGRLFLTTLEQLSSDPAGTSRDILTFLGLDPSLGPSIVKEQNKAATHRYTKEMSPLWRAVRQNKWLHQMAVSMIPTKARRKVQQAARKKEEITGRFNLTPAEEKDLLDQLAPDLRRLKTDYGFDAKQVWDLPI
ncbi:MAG: sulfotransferase [Pseudomonadota bacterium]